MQNLVMAAPKEHKSRNCQNQESTRLQNPIKFLHGRKIIFDMLKNVKGAYDINSTILNGKAVSRSSNEVGPAP